MHMNDDEEMRPIEPMWSPGRIADYMGVDVQTVRRWIWAGKMTSVKVGNVRRVPQSEVHRLVNGQRAKLEKKALENINPEPQEQ
jgi:excisionase family DNA binding protein